MKFRKSDFLFANEVKIVTCQRVFVSVVCIHNHFYKKKKKQNKS